MEYVYHGSAVPGIKALKAGSTLHGTDKQAVYLTGSVPYALLYIWDEGVTGWAGKYVTAGIVGGKVYYEEQFPNQLERFYKGASGWLYYAPRTPEMGTVDNRESMFYSVGDTPVQARCVPDVYEELLRYETAGELVVRRFEARTPERREALVEMTAQVIAEAGFYEEDRERQAFMKKYFSQAWERAEARSAAAT